MPPMYVLGARVLIPGEPELGLGTVVALEGERLVRVHFEAAEVTRMYSRKSAPLKRVTFSAGQWVTTREGVRFQVEVVDTHEGLYLYRGRGQAILETQVHPQIPDEGALSQLFAGRVSPPRAFSLRRQGWDLRQRAENPRTRGLVGPRCALLPHQLYVAKEVSRRTAPRVLLADEVGLGKTIEAGLIFSSLRSLGRAEKVLVLVPEALRHQWLAEFYRKFGVLFTLVDEDWDCEKDGSPFAAASRYLTSFDFLLADPLRLGFAMEEDWDLLIVDEAHHLRWDPEEPSDKWLATEAICETAAGVLLLTATPLQRGLETEFGLLNLADPERFSDFDEFAHQAKTMKEVASLAKDLASGDKKPEELKEPLKKLFPKDKEMAQAAAKGDADLLLRGMVDRHGTGRMFFRNRRARLKGFPKRIAHGVPLGGAWKKKIPKEKLPELALGGETPESLARRCEWLGTWLKEHPKEKVLVICRSPKKARLIDKWLEENVGGKRALFHEVMEIVERDRQAAWFGEPEGPQVLICSEIGGEGRNFQFCHHLVLMDLPADPDRLEQRIGRLDRIGQREEIHIWVPFDGDSPEELLFRWYEKALGAFEKAWTAGSVDSAAVLKVAPAFIEGSKDHGKRQEKLAAVLASEKKRADKLRAHQRESVDVLLDLNSFNEEEGTALAKRIAREDEESAIEDYLDRAFDFFGVSFEKLDEQGAALVKSHDFTYVEDFPELPAHSEKLVTLNRDLALVREDLEFLTADHAMVQGVLALLLDRELGRASVASLEPFPRAHRMIIRLNYLLRVRAPAALEAERFLPVQSYYRCIDEQGKTVEMEIEEAGIRPLPEKHWQSGLARLQQPLTELVDRVSGQVEKWGRGAVADGLKACEREMGAELDRLRSLHRVNPLVTKSEIAAFEQRKIAAEGAIEQSVPILDGIQLLLPT